MEMNEEFIRSKFDDVHCGHCGHLCTQADIELLEHNGNLWLFSVHCKSCKSFGFLTAIVKEGNEPEAIMDLTKAEIEKFSTQVCSDDVLDMYTFLKDFEGDFSRLFSKEKSTG